MTEPARRREGDGAARPRLEVVAGQERRAPRRPAALPAHIAVAFGVSAGLYAASLAGVTWLQAGADARLAAERAPAGDAIDTLRASHDALDADLAEVSAGLDGAAATYRSIADAIAGHEASLARIAREVSSAEGSAASLTVPDVSRLPTIETRTVYVASKPTTNACTTGSGKPC